MKATFPLAWFIIAGGVLLAGCNYETALTAKPTRKIDARLLGEWVAVDPDAKEEEIMIVRKFDDATYAVAMDDDIYRVYHSDFAGVAFVSAQDLNSDDRKYLYYRWSLSADDHRLTLQAVSTKVVPEETKGRAAIQKLIKANLPNPALFEKELLFTRKKQKQALTQYCLRPPCPST